MGQRLNKIFFFCISLNEIKRFKSVNILVILIGPQFDRKVDIIALVANAYINSLIEAQKSDFMKFLLHNFFVS